MLAMVLLVVILIQIEFVQNIVASRITAKLSKELNTEVRVKHVSVGFFNRLNLEGTLIRDRSKDTLLYAGALKVRVTDWFFLKDKAELKYIGLENAVVKMNRSDSVWNYQFLIDYLTPETKREKNRREIVLDLKKLDLKNVLFRRFDFWEGKKIQARVGVLYLDAENMDFVQNRYKIKDISVASPDVMMEDIVALNPGISPRVQSETGLYFNKNNIWISIDSLQLGKGRFIYHKNDAYKSSKEGLFDSRNIELNNLHLIAGNYLFNQDTMTANIRMRALERSGLELRNLSAAFRLTPEMMEFRNLTIQTPQSLITDYVSLNFNDFNRDFKNFQSDVTIRGNFIGSRIATNDMGYFAPVFKDWKKIYALSGNLNGTFNDFAINNLFLKSNDNLYVRGNLRMTGLPDFNNTIITLNNLQLSATANELAVFAPKIRQVKNPDFNALGRMNYQGSFSGTIHDFVTSGRLSTALGNINANVNMKLPRNQEPVYSGIVSTDRFNLGRFLNAKDVGQVSFDGTIAGNSFDLDQASATLNGRFDYLEVKDYTYRDIEVKGVVQNKFFTGELNLADSNAVLIGNVEVDFKGDKPRFNVVGDMAKINLKNTGFTNKEVSISALFDLNFEGNNIDDFVGTAKMLNAVVQVDGKTVQFDSLNIESYYDAENNKVLTIGSNEFDAEVQGNYAIRDIPATFQLFLNSYYPAIINKPNEIPQNQQARFRVNTYNFSQYASLIDPKLAGLDNVKIIGEVNTYGNGRFYLNADIPDARYGNYGLRNAVFTGDGNYSKLDLSGNVEDMKVARNTSFPNTQVSVSSEENHSQVKLSTGTGANSFNEVNLDADVYTTDDGLRINFRPSYFVLNDKRWDLQERGEIFIGKRLATARNVKFSQGSQELIVESESANSNNLLVQLRKIELGDILPLVVPAPKLEGFANGTVRLKNFFGPFSAEGTLKVDEFKIDGDSVGIVNLIATYDNSNSQILFQGAADNEKYKFDLNGRYAIRDTTTMPLVANFDFKGTRAHILNRFLSTVFSDIEADAYGKLTVAGTFKNPYLLGNLDLRNVGMTVNFTQVRYTADTITLNMTDTYIDLGNTTLKDRYNNSGAISGRIYHNRLKDMQYDIDAVSKKLLVLDTKAKDNQNFYGKAIGDVRFNIAGPQTKMVMNITGTVADSSDLYIPTADAKNISSTDFMVFKDYSRQEEQSATASTSSLLVNMDLTVNNLANMHLILDPLTGDIINAKGNGRLQIVIPPVGNITMRGRYNIESGRYDFNFQSFVPKPFEFTSDGNNYIEWNGDVATARLNIDAQYTAQNVSVNELLSSNSSAQIFANSNIRSYRGDVYVIVEIRGDLETPDISFRLDFPTGSVIKSDPDFAAFLNRLATDDNEMVKQATYLIVFNSFAPYGQTSNMNFASAGVNTISQLITSELNKSLSDALFRITGNRSLQVDISGSTYSSASLFGNQSVGNTLDRQIINARISKSILDGKLIVTFGNNFDFNINAASALRNNNFQWLPDISVQIILSKDGRLRMLIFNRTSLGLAGAAGDIGRQNRQGVSLSYSKDFDKIFDRKIERDTLNTEDTLMRFKE